MLQAELAKREQQNINPSASLIFFINKPPQWQTASCF